MWWISKSSCFYSNKFLNKKSSTRDNRSAANTNTSSEAIKSEFMSKQQLADELQKIIIKNFKKHEVQLSFRDKM